MSLRTFGFFTFRTKAHTNTIRLLVFDPLFSCRGELRRSPVNLRTAYTPTRASSDGRRFVDWDGVSSFVLEG